MLKTVTNSINASQIQTPITLPGDVTLSTGNLVIGTSGKGIDFSATPGTGTSELLSDYEEGTWTPGQGAGLTVVGAFSSTATYTKIGDIVFVKGRVTGTTSVAIGAGSEFVTGLPFVPSVDNVGSAANAAYSTTTGVRTFSNQIYHIGTQTATTAIAFSVTYKV
jgi:hypothetical protein